MKKQTMAYSQQTKESLVDDLGELSTTSIARTTEENPESVDRMDVGHFNKTDKMDTFFEQRKSDVMFELRNLKHGDRPVTGQNHRDNIQHFMKKHMTSSKERNGNENIPANVDNVEEHRPDSIVFEVQGIIEQRPVSSILQSRALRRQLENVIRGSIVGARARPLENQRARARPNAPAPSHSQRRVPEVIPDRPRLERRESADSLSSTNSFSSALSSQDQDLDGDRLITDLPTDVVDPTPENTPSPQSAPIEPPRQEAQSLSGEGARVHRDNAFAGLAWNDINALQRDELVQELSELVHSRLVSSTLDGEFRATLELLVQDRVVASGTNGPAVEQFVRSLPGSGVPHNDFSHLGIPPVGENEHWDNVSITSISAHSVPYTQTNSYLSREIQSLKSQMTEMKNMLKLSVDLQMDVQRAIRQEVAAAMAQHTGQSASCVANPPPSYPVNDTHCLICLERYSDSVLYQCGHMCVCYMCGKDLVSRDHKCPVCRAPIKDVIRAYKTNTE